MKIGMFSRVTDGLKYGGEIYEEMVRECLSPYYDVETFLLKGNYFTFIPQIFKLKDSKDIWIRNYWSVIARNKYLQPGKEISIFYEHEELPFIEAPLTMIFRKLFLKRLLQSNVVVTGSHFWKDFLNHFGYKNISVIHNGFRINEFIFSEEEINTFKRRYSLNEESIVYLGVARKNKGILEAYEMLKKRPYFFVTSGFREIKNLPRGINYFAFKTYRDFLLLLKSSHVVLALSKFDEGWCRVAHEALLCKTPVVGSGRGGMRELLLPAKQLICQDITKLADMVKYAIENRSELGQIGYDYAKNFSFERFAQEWKDLINSLL